MNSSTLSPDAVPGAMKRVVVVDPHPMARAFLRTLLEKWPECEVAAEGRTGVEALRFCRQHEPAMLITELLLPEMGAVAVLGELRASRAGTRMLIYSGCQDRTALADAARARPHGFVHKEDSLPALWGAIGVVMRGGMYRSPRLDGIEDHEGAVPGLELINPRERAVWQLIAESQPSKVICERLALSMRAVERTRGSLMKKLGVHDASSLTRLAVQARLFG